VLITAQNNFCRAVLNADTLSMLASLKETLMAKTCLSIFMRIEKACQEALIYSSSTYESIYVVQRPFIPLIFQTYVIS
jgi:hypothetical protein